MRTYSTGDMTSNRGSNRYSAMRVMAMDTVPWASHDPHGIRREWIFVAAIDLAYEDGGSAYDALREVNGRFAEKNRLSEAELDDMATNVGKSVEYLKSRSVYEVRNMLAARATRWWQPKQSHTVNGSKEDTTMTQQVNGTQVNGTTWAGHIKRLEIKFKSALVDDDVPAMESIYEEMQVALANERKRLEAALVGHEAVVEGWGRKVKAALAMMEA